MLDRVSGKIVHIDFGDCFEVAMTREKFPEKIPFRLTRMLVKAMEVICFVIMYTVVGYCTCFFLRISSYFLLNSRLMFLKIRKLQILVWYQHHKLHYCLGVTVAITVAGFNFL